MGIIKADIALESQLFGFWPCSGQGQFTLPNYLGRVNCLCPEQGQNPNSQLSSSISASFLPIEPQDHNQPIHNHETL